MPVNIKTLDNSQQDIRYIDALMSMIERSEAGSLSPYMYPNQREFYERNLLGATVNVLAFVDDTLVGYAALRAMTPWPDYLDPPEHPPETCALMLLNVVDPAYRGKGIGKQLADARIQAARARGFHHLFVTVHPDNTPSMRVLEQQGFQLIAQKPMFSNQLLRNLMQLDLSA